MFSYLVKRVLFMIPLLLGITIICFFVMRLAPGSPTDLQTQMNPKASAEMRQRLMSLYELDKPVYVQYASWLTKLARGDLGTSFSSDHRPVADKILERLPITIAINLLSLIIYHCGGRADRRFVGGPSGLAFRQGNVGDRFYRFCRADLLAGPAFDDFFRDSSGLAADFRTALTQL